jgi:hypothetical protein
LRIRKAGIQEPEGNLELEEEKEADLDHSLDTD